MNGHDIYTSIEDADLDEYTIPDEGDLESESAKKHFADHPHLFPEFKTQSQLHSAEVHMRGSAPRSVVPTKTIIPFGRKLSPGMRGRDVIAVKRALARAGFGALDSKATRAPVYGPWAAKNMQHFKRKMKVEDTSPIYGVNTHAKLGPWFDDYSFFLYCGYKRGESKEQAIRRKMVTMALYFYNTRDRVHYTQGARRMQIVRNHYHTLPIAGDIWEDCSSFDTGIKYMGGAPDPNNLNFNGLGFTGTEGVHGRSVSLEHAQAGDSVFYGHGLPWGHVAVYIGYGRIISHGSEVGPSLRSIDYDRGSLGGRGDIRSYL